MTKKKAKHSVIEKLIAEHEIVLYNDNVNSFDHVIDTLVEYCSHTVIQAEQCAYLVHYKGKCAIKVGGYKDLYLIYSALVEKGLSAEIN
jgi:ATP-dependent Clp protease adaptor protein ClpS